MASSQPQPLAGKYKILEKLHEGGMGAIYKVEHQLLEAVRVIKMIRPQLASDSKFRRRFLEEARGATQLDHPNIAKLHDFSISDDSTTWIVMEYISGLSLKEIVQGLGPPPLPLTLEIARQTLRALGFLHRKGWVHRDISPDNIMLTEDVDHEPQIKLIDLGIAKKIAGSNDLTSAGHFFAKMRYSSPEHYKESGAEARSDLYSFGLVLYELLTGEQAIRGEDPHLLMRAHLENPPHSFEESDPQGKVPQVLREAVMRSLAKDPGDRFATGEEFADTIAAQQKNYPLGKMDLPKLFDEIRAQQPAKPFSTGQTQIHLNDQFGTETTPTPPTTGSYRPWRQKGGSGPTVEMRMPSAEELFEQTAAAKTMSESGEQGLPSNVEEKADDQRTRRISLSDFTIPVVSPQAPPKEASPDPAEASPPASSVTEGLKPPERTVRLDPETAQAHLETSAMMAQLESYGKAASEESASKTPRVPIPPLHPEQPAHAPADTPSPPKDQEQEDTWSQATSPKTTAPPPTIPPPSEPPPSPPSPQVQSKAPKVSPAPPKAPPATTPSAPRSSPAQETNSSEFFDSSEAFVPEVEPAIELSGIEPVKPKVTASPPPGSRYAVKGPAGPPWWAELCRKFPQLEPLPNRVLALRDRFLSKGDQPSPNAPSTESKLSPEQQTWLANHRMHLVGAAAVALLLLLLVVFWPKGAPEPQKVAAPPPPIEKAPPPPPPPPPLPQEEVHPELETAQECMAVGDSTCVELALVTITEDGIELYPHEQIIREDLELWLEEFSAAADAEVEEKTKLIDEMLLALKEGPFRALSQSYDKIYLIRQEDPAAFGEYREKFIEVDKILSKERSLRSSRKKEEHLEVITHATRLMEMFPPHSATALKYQEEAAAAIESSAAAAEQAGNLGEAKGLLDELKKVLPAHPGLGEKIAAIENQLRADDNIQKTLDRAAQLGEGGKPYEGLAILRQLNLDAGSPYAPTHEELRQKLTNQFSKSDLHGPEFKLEGGGELPKYQRNKPLKLTFTITDDYRVVSVSAWGRVAEKGSWTQIDVEKNGDQYELTISPELHDNKRRFEFYLEAEDLSGHQSHYGKRATPQTLRRGRS